MLNRRADETETPVQPKGTRSGLFGKLAARFGGKKVRIAVIEMHGVIMTGPKGLNGKRLRDPIAKAFSGKPRAVILDIDSPGGSPVQSSIIGEMIREQAVRTGVPVYASVQDIAASGGYWLACAADEIWVNPMSLVGSIGVIAGGFGFPKLLERHGIERRVYTVGDRKAKMDAFSPEKPEDVAWIKGMMADTHTVFKDWVRERRGERLGEVGQTGKNVDGVDLFEADVWQGVQAKRLGMVDELGNLSALVRRLGGDPTKVKVCRPRAARRFPFPMGASVADALATSVVDVIEERITRSSMSKLW